MALVELQNVSKQFTKGEQTITPPLNAWSQVVRAVP